MPPSLGLVRSLTQSYGFCTVRLETMSTVLKAQKRPGCPTSDR